MSADLRTRIAVTLHEATESLTMSDCIGLADAVIRELTDAIPPIVATAIEGFAQSELSAMSYHGGSKDAFEVMERMNREALQIAKYATTHEKWNGHA